MSALSDVAAGLTAAADDAAGALGSAVQVATAASELATAVAAVLGDRSRVVAAALEAREHLDDVVTRLSQVATRIEELRALAQALQQGTDHTSGVTTRPAARRAGPVDAHTGVILSQIAVVRASIEQTAARVAATGEPAREAAELVEYAGLSDERTRLARSLAEDLGRLPADLAAAGVDLDAAAALIEQVKHGNQGAGQVDVRPPASGTPPPADVPSPTASPAVGSPAAASPRGDVPVVSQAEVGGAFPKLQRHLDELPDRPGDTGPTTGVLTTPDGQVIEPVVSGTTGPGKDGPGLTHPGAKAWVANVHAEGHAAAVMRRPAGPRQATLYVNNAPCAGRWGCDRTLPHQLPAGAVLTVYWPGGRKVYRGTGKWCQ